MSRNPLSKLLDRDKEPYVRPSIEQTGSTDSIASDATAPNNAGPGRNVGRLYDTLGARLENFLKRRARAQAQPSLQLVRVGTMDTVATDATARNIPGPGRNLGRLYDAIGARIEYFLSIGAGHLKLGPDALAVGIRSLRHYEEGPWGQRLAAPTSVEYGLLRKRCKKLLKHCRAQLLETQLKALDEVTALAIEDPYVRQVLAGVLHDSYLIPRYRERELHVSSSKAVISIKDNEAHEFWTRFMHQYLQSTSYDASHYNDSDVVWFRSQLTLHLRDPDISFLLGRLLRTQFTSTANANAFLLAVGSYIKAATASPQVIEWDNLSEVFDIAFMKQAFDIIGDSANCIMTLARHFPVLQKYGSTTRSSQSRGDHAEWDLQGVLANSHWITKLLRDLCQSEDLIAQLWYLRNLDPSMRVVIQYSVFGSEILLALAQIHHANHCDICTVRPSRGAEAHLVEAKVMLNYYLHGVPDEQVLATTVISKSMECTRYFTCALRSLVLLQPDTALLVDLPLSREGLTVLPSPSSSKHCIKRRHFYANPNITLSEEDEVMHEDDILIPSCSHVPQTILWHWLEVIGDERPFDATGHFPLLAGFDASGKELYVARMDSSSGYFYVSDGADNISFIDSHGNIGAVSRFEVMVLRHDPCDVGVQVIPDGAKLQTGPVYWIRGEEGGMDSDSDSSDSYWDSDEESDSDASADEESTSDSDSDSE